MENISTFDVHFAYAIPGKSRKPLTQSDLYKKRIWEISISAKHGYCLVVRSKKTNMYSDFIETLPLPLKEKISNGYGCDRKLHKQPCQGGCEGIRFPLDDSFLSSADHIIRWIEKETACRIGR